MRATVTLRAHYIALVIVTIGSFEIGWQWHARIVKPAPQMLSAAAHKTIRDWSSIAAAVGRVSRDCAMTPSEDARELVRIAMVIAPEEFLAETRRVDAEMTPETDCTQPGIRELVAQGWIEEGQR